ncbi:MAG: D-glycero-beta-D-manno-heptose-7-phosphate kinase [Candidatus Omnitrophica bacterium]|nr:D-glycero-beta-D-manno-heptose-7-phosphate kinase [Candidatus Omnitrophota bacterium]
MTKDVSSHSLDGLIPRFRSAKILVVGDLILDEFVWGQVSRISPEAPVPVVWVQSESVMPGGAANVANNIRALGGQVALAGIVGEDRWGSALLADLAARKIDTSGVLKSPRPTTVKTRVIAHHQQVVRVDREQRAPLPIALVERLIKAIEERIEQVDALIIEDYGKGVITRALLEAVIPLARSRRKIVTVDPKEEHFELYRGVTALTPNRMEVGEAVGRELESDADVRQAGAEILRRLECDALLITLGALASGATMEQAARMANYAAGIVVGKVGVAVATPDELRAKLSGTRAPSRAAGRVRRPSLSARR